MAKARHDSDLAASAIEKMRLGEPTTNREKAALKRLQDDERDKLTDQILADLPKKKYCAASGKMRKTLDDQADRFGVPCKGSAVDLRRILSWFHDLLTQKGHLLLGSGEDDDLLAGANSPALERCRAIKAQLMDLELQQKLGQYVPIELLVPCHAKIAAVLKTCGETLERVHGTGAADILREGIDSITFELDDILGRDADPSADADEQPPAKKTRAKKKSSKS